MNEKKIKKSITEYCKNPFWKELYDNAPSEECKSYVALGFIIRITQETYPIMKNTKPNVKGVVLNAFSEPFVLDKEIFDIVQNMKSRIE